MSVESIAKVNIGGTFRRSHAGFLLLDAMIAAGILACGVVALLNMLPTLMGMAEKQRLVTEFGDYALAKQQDMYTDDFSTINIATTQTGNFNTLIGTAATGVSLYSWEYDADDELTNVMKKVDLKVKRAVGSETVESDTWTFYVVDLENVSP